MKNYTLLFCLFALFSCNTNNEPFETNDTVYLLKSKSIDNHTTPNFIYNYNDTNEVKLIEFPQSLGTIDFYYNPNLELTHMISNPTMDESSNIIGYSKTSILSYTEQEITANVEFFDANGLPIIENQYSFHLTFVGNLLKSFQKTLDNGRVETITYNHDTNGRLLEKIKTNSILPNQVYIVTIDQWDNNSIPGPILNSNPELRLFPFLHSSTKNPINVKASWVNPNSGHIYSSSEITISYEYDLNGNTTIIQILNGNKFVYDYY